MLEDCQSSCSKADYLRRSREAGLSGAASQFWAAHDKDSCLDKIAECHRAPEEATVELCIVFLIVRES